MAEEPSAQGRSEVRFQRILGAIFALLALGLGLADILSSGFSTWMTQHVVFAALVTSAVVLGATVFIVEIAIRRRDDRRAKRRFSQAAANAIGAIAWASIQFVDSVKECLLFAGWTRELALSTGKSDSVPEYMEKVTQAISEARGRVDERLPALERYGNRWRSLEHVYSEVLELYDDYDKLIEAVILCTRWLDRYGVADVSGKLMTDEEVKQKDWIVEAGLQPLRDRMEERNIAVRQQAAAASATVLDSLRISSE